MSVTQQAERSCVNQRHPHFLECGSRLLPESDCLPRVTAGESQLRQREQRPRLSSLVAKRAGDLTGAFQRAACRTEFALPHFRVASA